MIPRKLSKIDLPALIAHMTSLQGEDRRLRFGAGISDDSIIKYVTDSFDQESMWFGCEDGGRIISACHTIIVNGEAELGCSVDSAYRGHGLAQAMFDRAITWLRTRNVKEVFMHCLTENQIMKHIARKNDMTLVSSYGETDATVEIQPPTPMTSMRDAYLDRLALYDMIFKNTFRVWKTTSMPDKYWYESKSVT